MRKFLLFILSFYIFLSFFYTKTFASYTVKADPPVTSANPFNGQPTHKSALQIFKDLSLSAQSPIITENTNTVTINFENLGQNKEYVVWAGKEDFLGKYSSSADRKLDFAVCGWGSILKLADKDNPGTGKCADDDYFHAGTYTLQICTDEECNNVVESVPLSVARYYPDFIISEKDPVTVTLIGLRKRNDDGGRNNYSIEISRMSDLGKEIEEHCTTVKPDGTNDPPVTFKSLEPGNYELRINERQKEGNSFARAFGSDCNTGFTYYSVRLFVGLDGAIKVEEVIADPYGQDVGGQERKDYKAPNAPCEVDQKTGKGKCPTGLGISINTSPGGFVRSVFGLILSIAGGIALLLIIYSGYQLITSQGTPEKLEAARQQLVSAIVGLLFIIFALVILQVIGVDILQIPGFEPSTTSHSQKSAAP